MGIWTNEIMNPGWEDERIEISLFIVTSLRFSLYVFYEDTITNESIFSTTFKTPVTMAHELTIFQAYNHMIQYNTVIRSKL